MSQIVICKIDAAHNKDARIPNQPFEIWGRMIPSIDHGEWSYEVEKNKKPTQDCFPDERYNVTKDDATFLGAYDGDTCVGLAVLRKDIFRYLYLDDLKVNRDYRGQGIGGKLIEACMHKAEKLGMQGVYTIGQDTNASACLFYLKHGFNIGGFDNHSYRGTAQEDSANIFFYRDLKND